MVRKLPWREVTKIEEEFADVLKPVQEISPDKLGMRWLLSTGGSTTGLGGVISLAVANKESIERAMIVEAL